MCFLKLDAKGNSQLTTLWFSDYELCASSFQTVYRIFILYLNLKYLKLWMKFRFIFIFRTYVLMLRTPVYWNTIHFEITRDKVNDSLRLIIFDQQGHCRVCDQESSTKDGADAKRSQVRVLMSGHIPPMFCFKSLREI